MAANFWSGEAIRAERKDIPAASCMAVSRDGQHALLASRRLLVMVELQRPQERLRCISWQSKYDAGTAAWSRVSGHGGADVAVTYNTQVTVFRCDGADLREVGKLQSHRRSITDLDWHWSEPLLATCSVDTNVHLWDVREPRRHVAAMCSVESACQVKWNRLSSQTLASSHEGDIRVWDRRKLNIPERYISAHTAKIHGLDWSPTVEHQLVTASQDMYVKFIDVTNPRNIVSMPKAKDPVWRARYTPFGSGLVTVAVPQLRRGDNYCLCLWNTNCLSSAVHTFSGHSDVVLDFDWRCRQSANSRDEREFDLVTWSRDQTLRLWPVKAELLHACGYEPAMATNGADGEHATSPTTDGMDTSCADTAGSQDLSPVESGPTSPTYSPVRPTPGVRRAASEGPPVTPSQPRTLEQEFRMINKNIDNVRIEKLNAEERTCLVSVVCGSLSAWLHVTFPPEYPSRVPELHFLERSRLGQAARQEVRKAWELTAEQHVRRNRSCLEPCLRNLASSLQRLMERQTEETVPPLYQVSTAALFPSANLYGSFKDVNVAFPRTSGARFCGNGTLVVFASPAYMKRLSSRGDSVTPRSLSALDAYLINYAQGPMGLSMMPGSPLLYPSLSRSPTGADSAPLLYPKDRMGTSSLGRRGKAYGEERPRQRLYRPHTTLVLCYDVQRLMPLNRELAEKYVLSEPDFGSMCATNANLAASVGRKDLEKIWNLIGLVGDPALVASNPSPNAERPWAQHPFGRKLVDSVLSHYLKVRDVQTVAMLCCVLGQKAEQPISSRKQAIAQLDNNSPGESPYHTVHPTETRRHPTLEGLGVALSRQNRSNSWSDVLDESRLQPPAPADLEERIQHENNCRMLDPARQAEFDSYKRIYAAILYKWRLTNQRAQMLKYVSTMPAAHCGLEVRTVCPRCSRHYAGSECSHCKRCTVTCVICHVSVKGMSAFCLLCGHGGHLQHVKQWFQVQSLCPAGCHCSCLDSFQQTFQE